MPPCPPPRPPAPQKAGGDLFDGDLTIIYNSIIDGGGEIRRNLKRRNKFARRYFTRQVIALMGKTSIF